MGFSTSRSCTKVILFLFLMLLCVMNSSSGLDETTTENNRQLGALPHNTSTPSTSPSTSPSMVPSVAPSSIPSSSPTTYPSVQPTFSPTSEPSFQPSSAPATSHPSLNPSRMPSRTPHTSPPSYSPSRTPTRLVTLVPSMSPTHSPSRAPTSSLPTFSPTKRPLTLAPSQSPTSSNPTKAPTTSKPSFVPSVSPTKPSRPSIVILLADDLDYGDVEYNGVSAVCSPTRVAILSGRIPDRDCIVGAIFKSTPYQYPPNMPSLAVDARNAGYRTAFFGKWHISNTPGHLGFDYWIASPANLPSYDPGCFCDERKCMDNCKALPTCYKASAKHCSSRTTSVCDIGHLQRPRDMGFEGWTCNMNRGGPVGAPVTEYIFPRNITSAEALAGIFVNYTQTVPPEDAFFIQVSFPEPHRPFFASVTDRQACFTGKICTNVDQPNSLVTNYFAVIAALDRAVGKIFQQLKTLHRENNTILIFTSDNAGESADVGGLPAWYPRPFRGTKRLVYDGGLRVPGFIHWPELISQNAKITQPTSLLDIVPTIHDIFKSRIPWFSPVPKNRFYDGESLLPLLQNPMSWQRTKPFGTCQPLSYLTKSVCHKYAYFAGRYKVIAVRNSFKDVELYDMVADPRETLNLAKINATLLASLWPQAIAWVANVYGDYAQNCIKRRRGLSSQDDVISNFPNI